MLLCGLYAKGQPSGAANEAWQLAQEGREAIATGQFQVAAEKYHHAHQLVPSNADYTLGLAHAKFFLKDYAAAMALCEPLTEGKAAKAEAFQVLGNCLDAQEKSYEALETYRKGLKRFPQAGVLYMEMGILESGRHRDAEALTYWEQGIVAQPTFASNYYFAAQNLLNLGDLAWAAVYAEVFINIERTGERVREMSRLLMGAYERARVFDYSKAFQWHFFQVKDSLSGGFLPPPPYPHLLDSAFGSEFMDTARTLSIVRLAEVRRFACQWIPQQLGSAPGANLLQWQQTVAREGHLEAYHFWMLYDARPDEFMHWYENNKARYEAFEGWFLRNALYRHIKSPIVRRAPTTEEGKRK